jgi:GDP-4-dehydro-6-deoxy-D-mannose reductase
MRILVTGGAGFVGRHLLSALRQRFGANAEIVATSKSGGGAKPGVSVLPLDVTDRDTVADMVRRHGPTHIVHLAALAAVQTASAHADLAWRVHVFGTLNIADAIMRHAPDCTLLFIGSGQVYGASARGTSRLTEDALLAPTNEYAVTKAAADLALGSMAERGLKCLRLRPFNHTGRGQTEDFVIPSFAMQIARIEAGQQAPTIKVGNLDAERDFLDVRDVSEAYALAIQHAARLQAGAIYNIASGIPRRIADILASLIAMSDAGITIQYDQARMRPADIASFVGDSSRAERDIGWRPRLDFDQTLKDVLAFARMSVSKRG